MLDIGPGPGRFSLALGGEGSGRVLLDLSIEMLRRARSVLGQRTESPAAFVRGDAASPPFADGSFATIAIIGNVLGHLEDLAWPSLAPFDRLVAADGTILLEIVPGFGERSNYLSRLPPGSVTRVLRAPRSLVAKRVRTEGFARLPRRSANSHGFRRLSVSPLEASLGSAWRIREVMAVAPALGSDPDRLERVRMDPKAWSHLLLVEEELGRDRERWINAAAVLVALTRE